VKKVDLSGRGCFLKIEAEKKKSFWKRLFGT
jgi:hypothetical protein